MSYDQVPAILAEMLAEIKKTNALLEKLGIPQILSQPQIVVGQPVVAEEKSQQGERCDDQPTPEPHEMTEKEPPAAAPVTYDDLQKAFLAVRSRSGRDVVVKFLADHGWKTLKEAPESDWAAVLAKLEAL